MVLKRITLAAIVSLMGCLAFLPQPALAMTGSGTVGDPFMIYNVTDLQDIRDNMTAHYQLANDIDASATVAWNGGKGFEPIGDHFTNFTGSFDGNGYTITDLYINRPTTVSDNHCYGGIFGFAKQATFQNFTVVDPVITVYEDAAIIGTDSGECTYENITVVNPTFVMVHGGYSGGILGYQYADGGMATGNSNMTGCHVLGGTITANAGSVLDPYIGGLIGWWNEGQVACSDSSADITALGNDTGVLGGLIGWIDTSALGYGPTYIHDCYATGNVTGLLETAPDYGGFAGWIDGGTFENCYATGDVNTPLGPLSGGFTSYLFDADMDNCYATGDVYVTDEGAGFCSNIDSTGVTVTLDNCYATGDIYVTATGAFADFIGGFVGFNMAATIQESFCTGDIFIDNTAGASLEEIGGFAGENYYNYAFSPTIIQNCFSRTNIYVTAGATAGDINGGFCGWNDPDGLIENSYSTGVLEITGTNRGGFCGLNEENITNCFWDIDTSLEPLSDGGTGENTTAMKTEATFTGAGWDFVATWCWGCPGINDDYPILQNTLPLGWACCSAPAAPDALHIIAITQDTVTLAWQEGGGLPQYHLIYKLTGYPTGPLDGTTVYDDNITSAKVISLTPGVTHYFGVWSYSTGLYSATGAYCSATTSAGHGLPATGTDAGGEEDATILQGSPVGGLINFVSAYGQLPAGTVGLMGYSSLLIFMLVAVACYNRSVAMTVICGVAGMALGRQLGVFSTIFLVLAIVIGLAIGSLRGGQPTGG